MSGHDLLLTWMSHLGKGSKLGFESAVREVFGDEEEPRNVRRIFSDLGHVDFFGNGTARWRVFPPTLVSLPAPGLFALCGGRTPKFLEQMGATAEATGLELTVRASEARPATVFVRGASVEGFAAGNGLLWRPDWAERLAASVPSIPVQAALLPRSELPTNWAIRSFDPVKLQWVDGRQALTAIECRSRFGERKYFFQPSKWKYVELPYREAVWASLSFRKFRVAVYVPGSRVLSVPAVCPLPFVLARALCLSSGELGRFDSGWIRYEGVAHSVVCHVLRALGQPHPGFLPVTV